MSESLTHCSFCDKHKDRVGKLIVSHKVAICNECVELCGSLLKDDKPSKKALANSVAIQDPIDIREYLDRRLIRQD